MFDWANQLHLDALWHLQRIYQGPFIPTQAEIENEALDIVDEINSRFGGDFNRWRTWQEEVRRQEEKYR